MARKFNYLTLGSDVCSCVLVLVLMAVSSAADHCSRRLIVLTIEHEDCMPKRVMTYACRGACTSYTRPSVEFPGEMERFCQCCDEDDIREHLALVRCPNMEWEPGQKPFRLIRVNMKVPRSCRCRPCSETPQHIVPAENDIWSQGKRSSNVSHFW